MYSILLATWLALPVAPLNPYEQDTASASVLHVSANVTAPTSISTAGPGFSTKYELRISHPILIRLALDYNYSEMNSILLPKGNLHTGTTGADLLYYRGSNQLLGYLGFGIIYSNHWFSPSNSSLDSLLLAESVTSVEISNDIGYRLFFGLYYRKLYSFEISITEVRPDLVKWSRFTNGSLRREAKEIRTGGFRFSIGYLFPLSSL